MPIPTLANRPKAGWAVLLYGPPPEIQLLAGDLDDSRLEIVRIDDHFFLQAPEVFDPLSSPEEVAWAAAAVLQQLNTAARLRYAVRLPIHSGAAILVNREGFWDQDDVDRAVAEVRGERRPPPPGLLGEDLDSCQAAASSCSRPRFVRSRFCGLEPASDIRRSGTRSRPASGNVDCGARPSGSRGMRLFQATVFGSTPRRPGLSRRSRFPWPKNRTHSMSPLAAKTFVRGVLEELVLLRSKGRTFMRTV